MTSPIPRKLADVKPQFINQEQTSPFRKLTPGYSGFNSVQKVADYSDQRLKSARNTSSAFKDLMVSGIKTHKQSQRTISELECVDLGKKQEKKRSESPFAHKSQSPERVTRNSVALQITAQQRQVFDNVINQQQLAEVKQQSLDYIKQDKVAFNKVRNDLLAEQHHLQITLEQLRQDIELLHIKHQKFQKSVDLTRLSVDNDQKQLQTVQEALEQLEQISNLEEIHRIYSFVDPSDVVNQLENLELRLIKFNIQNQQFDQEQFDERQKQAAQTKENQGLLRAEEEKALQTMNYWRDKLRQLKQEMKRTDEADIQSCQSQAKSHFIQNILKKFVADWREVLDFQFLKEVGRIPNATILEEIQRKIYKFNDQQFIKNFEGGIYLKLAKMCLEIVKEFDSKEIQQNVPGIAKMMAASILDQQDKMEQLRSKIRQCEEEEQKVYQMKLEVLRFKRQLELDIEVFKVK